ncbi:Ankyrin-3 [Durusdinium trenchii]
MLPPTAVKAAGWATGTAEGRDLDLHETETGASSDIKFFRFFEASPVVAMWRYRNCANAGKKAPFAGMVLIGFGVDVSSFLGELRAERDQRHLMAREILDWANREYPEAFFFAGLEAGYLAAVRDLEGGSSGALTKEAVMR